MTLAIHECDCGSQAHGRSIAFSPDGMTLASGGWDGVRLWAVKTGEQKRVFTGHGNAVSSVSFSPDGTRLASGSHDGTVLLWKVH